ncbi:MAG TPA: hypothetical protein VHL78_14150 [Actinomycetota bacterium]|nr:hypothetical protein [Actinomycetota bacterium]
MTDGSDRRAERMLWLGVALFVAGRIVDLVWHATHPEFETAADQIRAHAVVWLGVLAMVGASATAVQRGIRSGGHRLVVAAGGLYVAVAVWHFWEHTQLRDPDLPHLLLTVASVLLIGGAAWVAVVRLRRRGGAATGAG